MRTLKIKSTRNMTVEIVDYDVQSPRYALVVNGVIKQSSNDLCYLISIYERY